MMRRMLKRKIHPELECKTTHKAEAQNKATILELLGKKNIEATESVSLLQIPGMFIMIMSFLYINFFRDILIQ